MATRYAAGFRNSAGAITWVGNRMGEPSFAPHMFQDKELAIKLAMKAAEECPLWGEVFIQREP